MENATVYPRASREPSRSSLPPAFLSTHRSGPSPSSSPPPSRGTRSLGGCCSPPYPRAGTPGCGDRSPRAVTPRRAPSQGGLPRAAGPLRDLPSLTVSGKLEITAVLPGGPSFRLITSSAEVARCNNLQA